MRAMKWMDRFRAVGSPLLERRGHRVLFVLVVVGALLVATLPEAAFVLPAIDAVGLDIVTVLAALELRHYLATVGLLVGVPAGVAIYLRVPGLWPYACMWPVIWIRTLMGTIKNIEGGHR
jgi:hypothetical protein